MDAQLNLDGFYSWVCEVNEKVRSMEETLERVRAWGVASLCWQVKLGKIQSDLRKLRIDVANSIATREANRRNLIIDAPPAGKAQIQGRAGVKVLAVAPRKRGVVREIRPQL